MANTHTVTLTDDAEARLAEKAARAGLTVGEFLQRLANKEAGISPAQAALRALLNRTPEQIAADREAVMRTVRKARPLSPGQTLDDVVKGLWPGNETEEEILKMLEELS